MTTIALIFFGYIVAQALLILAACALVARKPNPFKRTKLPAKVLAAEVKKSDVRMERAQLAKTLRRVHP